MITETPAEVFDVPRLFDRTISCWNCKQNPRVMVFLPNDQGSYLSIHCSGCTKAPEVLKRLKEEK